MSVTPADQHGLTDGKIYFNRLYQKGTTVTLSAPPVFNRKSLIHWRVNGTAHAESTLSLTLDGDQEVTAVYQELPSIGLNHTRFNFGADASSRVSDAQTLLIRNTGTGTFQRSKRTRSGVSR
ncbi:MAG: hypothetical protein ACM3SY_14425 [Candidatus Omnitrophota bacterium]